MLGYGYKRDWPPFGLKRGDENRSNRPYHVHLPYGAYLGLKKGKGLVKP